VKTLLQRTGFHRWTLFALLALLGGCSFLDGDDTLENSNPGNNDQNVVAAFGDSITQGNRCPCAPYPARLSPMIGKTVVNAAIHGTTARASIGRTQAVINSTHPAFMLILYGINDMIHSHGVPSTLDALDQMVLICKQNQVLPVLATYPVPVKSYRLFAYNIIALNQGIRDLSKRHGIRCVDLEREFALPPDPADPGNVTSPEELFTGEGLHPNEAGTQIMALAFADLF
jgi:lysophospholipase L1-like esterase